MVDSADDFGFNAFGFNADSEEELDTGRKLGHEEGQGRNGRQE
jgi:hypothetical protein